MVRLGWISFLNDIASEMVYPLMPLFIVGALRAPAVVLGFIEGFAEVVVSFLKGWSGWHSDRAQVRVRYLRWGYGFSFLAKPMLAAAYGWPLAFMAKALDRLGKGVRSPAKDALISEAVTPDIKGRAYGFDRAMDSAGAMVGVLLCAGLMALLPGQYRKVFLITAVPGLLALLGTTRLRDVVRPADDAAAVPTTGAASAPTAPWQLLPGAYWRVFTVLLLFAAANSSDTFILLRAHQLGMSDVLVLGVYALYNLVYASTSYPAGILSDRLGRWGLMGVGWAIYAAAYLAFAAIGQASWMWLIYPLYGVYVGITDGVGKAALVDYIPGEIRGTGLGLYYMSAGFVTLCASVWAGVLWDRWGPAAPFWFGGCMACVALLSLLVLRPRRLTAAT